jgi:hypothetical protein
MTTYVSWFNKLIDGMANVGIRVKGILYHAHPTRFCTVCKVAFSDGKCPKCDKSVDWRKATCLKAGCKSNNAFVFQTKEDPEVFFIFCKKCNKWGIVKGIPPLPVRYVSNVPPPIGSKTKPNV